MFWRLSTSHTTDHDMDQKMLFIFPISENALGPVESILVVCGFVVFTDAIFSNFKVT